MMMVSMMSESIRRDSFGGVRVVKEGSQVGRKDKVERSNGDLDLRSARFESERKSPAESQLRALLISVAS